MRLNKVTIYARITTVGYGQYTCISKTEKFTDCTHLPLEGTGVELRCFLGRVHNTTPCHTSLSKSLPHKILLILAGLEPAIF